MNTHAKKDSMKCFACEKAVEEGKSTENTRFKVTWEFANSRMQ